MTPFDPRLSIIAAEAKVKTCHVYHCWHSLREMGKTFHVAAFASFAGIEPRHVEAILSALQLHQAMPVTGRAAPIARGSRLPSDWQIPDDWIAWARQDRKWTIADARAEADVFANYWQAKAGQGAVKTDWRKTWQNWVRASHRVGTIDHAKADKRVTLERQLATEEMMGRDYEADVIRRQIAALGNVVPFPRTDSNFESKVAV